MIPINEIICGDCLEVMKEWPDNCVDLVLTDPPYGIGGNIPTSNLGSSFHRSKIEWDICSPSKLVFSTIRRISVNQIIWGGNYFPFLWNKPNRGFIVWDKIQTTTNYADCEFAWTSFDRNARLFRYCYSGNRFGPPENIQGVGAKSNRLHPTQKPVELGVWLLEQYTQPTDLILDCYCGSGSFCAAAKILGRNYIGIDISEEYCEISRQRIRTVETGVPVKEQRVGQMALFESAV